ncbi:LOW QUALITY PROTEIN: hypothetical protein PHMEG_00012384 [Phytophthora megakarya]|uniref:Uncharacterized protein n=1 Tax=Phytophthora megakarya TaxID=4795 RepID=A0A225W8X4_9STRA|nr:LOW QUALITY PROTEIN: hypothetical protein PHMEG_00012384 [Phytophthora megakarya]
MDSYPPVFIGDINGIKFNSFVFQFETYFRQKDYDLLAHGDFLALVQKNALVWFMIDETTINLWTVLKIAMNVELVGRLFGKIRNKLLAIEQAGGWVHRLWKFKELNRVVQVDALTGVNLFLNECLIPKLSEPSYEKNEWISTQEGVLKWELRDKAAPRNRKPKYSDEAMNTIRFKREDLLLTNSNFIDSGATINARCLEFCRRAGLESEMQDHAPSYYQQARYECHQDDREITCVHRGISTSFLFQKTWMSYLLTSGETKYITGKQFKRLLRKPQKLECRINPNLCFTHGVPTFCVKKPVVRDYRTMNNHTAQLYGFTQWLLPIQDARCRFNYTAFQTADRAFEYLVVPMGLSSIHVTFNDGTHRLLNDMAEFCLSYVDGIYIFTRKFKRALDSSGPGVNTDKNQRYIK